MKFIELLRNIKGYIVFEAQGGFTERFINLCAKNHIAVFDVTYKGSSLRAKITFKQFSRLRFPARKTGVKIKTIKKCGLPFYLREHSNRFGLLVGAVFSLAFMLIMNCFLWCIDASGSEKYSPAQIIEAAEKVGVRHGIFIYGFDEDKAAREIYKLFDNELSWVTVNIKGSRASIKVRDADNPGETQTEDKEPCNIVADFDGVILSDETYSGIKSISKGSAVKKGDLLISGVMDNMDLSVTYYKAKGKFTALHDNSEAVSVKYNGEIMRYTEYKKYYVLYLFGLKIPLGFYDSGDTFKFCFYPEYAGERLPFGIECVFKAEYESGAAEKEITHILAADRYSSLCFDKYKNTKLLKSDIKLISDNSGVKITGEHQCIDFIGESQPIITENIET